MNNFKGSCRYPLDCRGFSLLEVLIGIGIFAVGMLALASLQGALTRSSAEAKVRTTAVNIAEQIIENHRGFNLITDFTGIVDIPSPGIKFDSAMNRNPGTAVGMVYTVTQDVTDYYYNLASDVDTDPPESAFTTTAPTGVTVPDFKTVEVTVTWSDNRDYVIDEKSTAGNLGGGSVRVSATISNASVTTALKVSAESEDDIIAPKVVYTPGDNPDIVSLGLGDQKFKESLTPEPKVYRDNLETRFDVITYSLGDAGALFLRREEFVAVSCECTLAGSDGQGKSPAIWAGDEYTEPVTVTKAYGTPAIGIDPEDPIRQSPLCDTCCRDHHDGGGSALYDPSRPSTEYSNDGDHKHYYRQGVEFVEAVAGNDYLEACRFVRKDGFFRLTQDFRLEGLNTFAEDYLITTNQVKDYSEYVIEEVYGTPVFDAGGDVISYTPVSTSYVPKAITTDGTYQLAADPPTVKTAPRTASGPLGAADLTLGYTYLPTNTNNDIQQLRGRSIYIDNLSSDLRTVITCIEDAATDAEKMDCKSGDVELDKVTGVPNVLEIIPFFEVQTTYLNDWQKHEQGQNYFSLTNQTVTTSDANGPTHSRGKVINQPTGGADMVHTIAFRGVTGVTSSDPINPIDYVLPTPATGWEPGHIEVITGVTPSAPNGKVITIKLSSEVGGLKAANVGYSVTDATCSYVTTAGEFTCFIPSDASSPSLTITGFDKPPKEIRLCSNYQFGSPAELPVTSFNGVGAPKTVDLIGAFAVPSDPSKPSYGLWLTEDSCPGGWGS